MANISQTIQVRGMHCSQCEEIAEQAVLGLRGVSRAQADFGSEVMIVTYNPAEIHLPEVLEALEAKGYPGTLLRRSARWKQVLRSGSRIVLALLGMAAIFYLGSRLPALPSLSRHASAGLLFIAGLLTGFHCVGMCGGFIIGYTARNSQRGKHSYARSHLAYGVGKTLSYTVLGGVCGWVGSLITFTTNLKAVAAMAAGVFLIGFGLNMLHLLPHLRWFSLATPRWLSRFVHAESEKHHSPFAIGLLNGLMIACGPLQAMYIMAAGTGSPWEGAKILLIFALGTLPLLLGFGFLTSVISRHTTEQLLKVSGVVVLALGLIMFNRGLILGGGGYDFSSLSARMTESRTGVAERAEPFAEQIGNHQTIRMVVTRKGFEPNKFVLRKSLPVRWVIIGKELNDCNRSIVVPKLNLQFEVRPGEQVIEFTPVENGTIPWSCWMGMLSGTFVVAEDQPMADRQDPAAAEGPPVDREGLEDDQAWYSRASQWAENAWAALRRRLESLWQDEFRQTERP